MVPSALAVWSRAGDGDSDENAPIPFHGRTVVIPIRMLPGNATVVVDERLHRIRQMDDVGAPFDEYPLTEEGLRENAEHDAWIGGQIAGLGCGFARADDHVTCLVDTDRYR